MVLPLPSDLSQILRDAPALAEAYVVGGCVRDWLLDHRHPSHCDVEVFGVSYAQLVQALTPWGRTDLVGRSFGVVKLVTPQGHTHDFTIPRRDSKMAPGHKGFEVQFDPLITPAEAAARRDFTINALMYNPRSGEILDFFGGQSDLTRRILRHTSGAFAEDPLRVLRGMQFAGRFDLEPAAETIEICRRMVDTYRELAPERVREEWFKWAVHSSRPSRGLRFLADTGWLDHFPEIAALARTPQDPHWHPEGDVFVHTCHCCDALVLLPEWQDTDPSSRIVYMLATLAHDFGKPPVTQQTERHGRECIVSPGHDEAGVPLTERFLERIHTPHHLRDRILPLVRHHLAHLNPVTDRSVRRLARRLVPETIEGLCLVMKADHLGRPPRAPAMPDSIQALQAKAQELALQKSAPRPLLKGRHLIASGLAPGPRFKTILEAAFEAQLEGRFHDLQGAQGWLAQHLEKYP